MTVLLIRTDRLSCINIRVIIIVIIIFDMCIFNSIYLLHSYNPSFLICLCFNMVSFRGQKKLGPRPDRSPLGV